MKITMGKVVCALRQSEYGPEDQDAREAWLMVVEKLKAAGVLSPRAYLELTGAKKNKKNERNTEHEKH